MKRYLLLGMALLLLPMAAISQTTGATIEGTVTNAQGQPLPGANVVAIHQPTGSRYGASTRSNGNFTLSGVRVGGPYLIKVTFVGYNAAKKKLDDINLSETIEVNFKLQEGSVQLDELTVVGTVNSVFNENVTGAKTHISTKEIARTPTISRSLTDYLQSVPQASGGFSFGGGNDRYNSLLIDGATMDDVFGLGTATPGSRTGVGSPISIDAIAEFNVALAPFSVTNNGFTGARINAVTRSGTNEYSGSAYFYTRSNEMEGRYIRDNGTLSPEFDEFKERYFGLRLGGPIIKDELFFFVSAEYKRESAPISTTLGNKVEQFPVAVSVFEEITQITQNRSGYDPGGYGNVLSADQNNVKLLAKINWNINENNKLMFRYNYLQAFDDRGISRSPSSYSFSNARYKFKTKMHSFVVELNSDIGNNMSNMFRAVYTHIKDYRNLANQPYPDVGISVTANEPQCRYCSISMGINYSYQRNELIQDLIEITDNFKYIAGDHEFTFGTSNKIYFFDNLFVQNAFGSYSFRANGGDSVIENFRQGDPYNYNYSYLLPGGNPRAQFPVLQFGLYAQDRWTINDRLMITYGLRVDVPFMPKEPSYNPDVPEAFPGYSTSRIASGNFMWSPRFGFNWDLSSGDTMTQIRGGIGIFSGPPPIVWISNQYANTGVDYARLFLQDHRENGEFVNAVNFYSGDPYDQFKASEIQSLEVATSSVNLISEDFQYPQSLKINLAIDQELPWGITATLEGIYTNHMNAVVFRNLNIEQVATSAHGRPLYDDPEDLYRDAGIDYVHSQFNDVILLDNTNKGYQYSITGRLQKQFYSGLYFSVSYTYNIAKSVNSGSSSVALSNWQYNEAVDPNHPALGISDYNRKHRVVINTSYEFSYGDGFSTMISLFMDTHSGTPFSWIYFGNANGDTNNQNDLIYVPEIATDGTPDDVVLTGDNWDALNAFINSHPSLAKHRGEFVPRNNATTPWETYLDLKVVQTIPTFQGHTLELSLSMSNVLNFLNDSWGAHEEVSYGNVTAWTFERYNDSGKPVISFDPSRAYRSSIYTTDDVSSVWRLQVGVRYNF